MNYYLAREGQTYGPYPQETFPEMLKLGQVVLQDLVCPEGGSDWVELSTVPALAGTAPRAAVVISGPTIAAPVVAASSKTAGSGPSMATPTASSASPVSMPTPVASSRLRISGTSGVSSHATAPAVAAAVPVPAYSPAPVSQNKTGLMEKAAGAWGALRILGYAAVAIFIVGSLIAGYFVSQREKKEIAKLQSQPGWKAFDAGNSQINAESSTEGFGNNGEAQRLAKALATATETVQRMSFEVEKTPRYRGRSKLGLVISAVDAATAGKGHFQTYIEIRDDRAIVLVHVPEFSRYKSDARQSMTELCWETANVFLGEAMKAEAMKAQEAKPPPAPARLAGARPPTGRPLPGRSQPANAKPVAPAVAKVEAPPAKERTLVVGVRGKSDYECVFVGKISGLEEAPVPAAIKKNVPSHQALVKWFGEEKPGD